MGEIGVVWMQCLAICGDREREGAVDRIRLAIAAVEALEALFPAEIQAYADAAGLREAAERIKTDVIPMLGPSYGLRRRKTDLGPFWSVKDKH